MMFFPQSCLFRPSRFSVRLWTLAAGLWLTLAPAGFLNAQENRFFDFEDVLAAPPEVEVALEQAGVAIEPPLLFPLGWKFNAGAGENEYRLIEDEKVSHSKDHCLFIRGHMQCEVFWPVQAGQDIRVKFWAKEGSGGGPVRAALYQYDAGYQFLGEQRLEEGASPEWSEYQETFTIPSEAGAGSAVSYVAVALGSESGAYFDDVTVDAGPKGSAPAAEPSGHLPNGAAASPAADEGKLDLVQTTMLAKEWQVEAEGTGELKFDLGDFSGKQVRLRLDGRIQWGGLGGSTGGMTITVNGQPLVGRRLMNKPLAFTMREGTVLQWSERNSNGYRLMYSSDFSDRLKTDTAYLYGLPEENQDPFHFLWDITPFVLPGANTIAISSPSGMALTLKFRDVAIELGDPIAYKDPSGEAEQATPAPTGPLPVVVPRRAAEVSLAVEVSSFGQIRFQAEGQNFEIHSRASLPEGKWSDNGRADQRWQAVRRGTPVTVNWQGIGYEFERRVAVEADHIAVADTIRNTGAEAIGVMVENRLKLPNAPERTLLGGRETAWVTETRSPYHPTAMAELKDLTVGLVAENDLFRLHAELFREDRTVGLADQRLGVPAGAERTLEWSAYVVPQGNYWDFVNALRRNWGSNIPLIGPVTFTGSPQEWGQNWQNDLTVDILRGWLAERHNAIPMVMTHVGTDPNVSPAAATKEKQFWYHGTAIPHATHWRNNTRAVVRVMKEVDPNVKVFAYIHPNLTTEVGYDQKYRDSVARDGHGTPAKSVYKPEPGVFIPTLENSYGKALEEVYRGHIDDLDANLYVDEITVGLPSEGLYDEWDGCTAEIDPVTHALTKKISSGILLMQPWLDRMMSYAKSKGKTAFVNTAPPTRTMNNWKIQHITEDTGPAGITSTHLSTPLAWTYDTGELPGYQHIRESLSHGAISFSRSGAWSDHMFPLTPIELHAGTIIGEERILTIHSGKFGWGDASGADVLVYDGQGQRVEKPDVKEVREGGVTFTEVRMPSDHFAILVRKPTPGLSPAGSN